MCFCIAALQSNKIIYHASKHRESLWTASSTLECVQGSVDMPGSEEIGRDHPITRMVCAAIVPRHFLCKPVDLCGAILSTWQESLKQKLDYGKSVGTMPHPLASGGTGILLA